MDMAAVALVTLVAGLALGWLSRALSKSERGSPRPKPKSPGSTRPCASSARPRRNGPTLAARTDIALRETFGALSAEALQRNNEAFVALAEARLGMARAAADGDLAQRQQAIDSVVGPLRESLDAVQQQLRTVERDRAGSYSALLEQIGTMRQTSEQLRTETAQLVTALRAPQVRGRWGELQLERAVEAAGMTEHIDYVTQVTASGEDGVVRPDLVVRLVGGKNVVVDSKVAFNAYLEAMEARDDATRANRLKAHARHLREHIDSLGAKAYWERFAPSPEFVVCFVPADAFLDAALREEPTLLEHAFARNVVRGHAVDAGHAAAHRRLHLAAGCAGRKRGGGAPARARAVHAVVDDGRPHRQARACARQCGRLLQPDGVVAREPGFRHRSENDRAERGRSEQRRRIASPSESQRAVDPGAGVRRAATRRPAEAPLGGPAAGPGRDSRSGAGGNRRVMRSRQIGGTAASRWRAR